MEFVEEVTMCVVVVLLMSYPCSITVDL